MKDLIQRKLSYFLLAGCFINVIILVFMYLRSQTVTKLVTQIVKEESARLAEIDKKATSNYDTLLVIQNTILQTPDSSNKDLIYRFSQNSGYQNKHFLNLIERLSDSNKVDLVLRSIKQPDSATFSKLIIGTWYSCPQKVFSVDLLCQDNAWRYSFFKGGLCKFYGIQTNTFGNVLPGEWRINNDNNLFVTGRDTIQGLETNNSFKLKFLNTNTLFSIEYTPTDPENKTSPYTYHFFKRQIGFIDKYF